MEDFDSIEELDEYLLKQNGKIIHQIWFKLSPNSKKLFKKFGKFRDGWRLTNPNWCYMLWNKDLSKKFIKTKYPEYYDMYLRYKYDIQRIDALKYFVLCHYGGFYVDMDMECLKSLDEVKKNYSKNLYIIETPNKVFGVTVSNMFIYSIPRHPFWKKVFIELEKAKDSPWYYSKHLEVMCTTGPYFLDRAFTKYCYRMNLNIFPAELFNPKGLCGNDEIFKPTKNMYCIHWGEGSWNSKDSDIFNFLYRNIRLILVVIIVMFLPLFIFKDKNKI